MPTVTVIGAGLAGSEAAWQLAVRGIDVELVEMRPARMTPAHHTGLFAELVCSNSFKSSDPATAPGMLKEELATLGSVILAVARAHAVPAGAALAVDRERFAAAVTRIVASHPLVRVINAELAEVPRTGPVIVATGPLTSDALSADLASIVGAGYLSFYDAAAPIVDATSLDMSVCFFQSRYGKGEGSDYLNCPFDAESYERFIDALTSARRVVRKDFEPDDLFSACQPIEEIARTGRDALRFGPLKPVGLTDPRTGTRPWAVLQLRPENRERTMYNLVGCQTNLAFDEQARVFRMVPGLESAEFLRYGVMHRNTYVDSPRVLDERLAVRMHGDVRLAGQITGTEGYLEAAATGLWAALVLAGELTHDAPPSSLPRETALGSLIAYATDPATRPYQPMHVNFGLLPPLEERIKDKRARKAAFAARGRQAIAVWAHRHEALVAPGLAALRTAASTASEGSAT
ncbi:methylenetetrahydrofolate--tRNA-(uracil(54)-C(5))-methyltransferase (FADH(2)-oxidizing) TrmFO [Coriobacteriia bacterium Es71-Z0120]|uniref:methylenetetrahydrofolate--tRNA-(uracil(54)- C(5))-methyltransferase (FADH(2)-oxidizing) TrmFO n=1 Tax=Parvivirga hydrogeniphila TaxID=2939460 RepID=UPI002260D74E|nr:methylenetetrahydrofolate--tRNA-(uracil(54)-C(5))-methyltransferase (FADH(2)-oxidizing) TrmFO [Parvivirga hydrogeniphila]MCL4079581.1 methylenetetrahydrofolate--tRNA-(uracil(54)-C(5))-methyltransferase (FADH(2)-oxidizing) TrmFO [Parvivirga hydrogeniphila]